MPPVHQVVPCSHCGAEIPLTEDQFARFERHGPVQCPAPECNRWSITAEFSL